MQMSFTITAKMAEEHSNNKGIKQYKIDDCSRFMVCSDGKVRKQTEHGIVMSSWQEVADWLNTEEE
jgi:hypothetical protein